MTKGKFYEALSRRMLVVNQSSAGAGFSGILGLLGFMVIAALFFVIENFFLSLMFTSFGLLCYISGSDIARVAVSAFTIFFSNKHLSARGVYLQDTMMALKDVLNIRRNAKGEIVSDPLADKAKITLPDNPLSQDIKKLVENDKDKEYANYIANQYFEETHELYVTCADNYDFVSTTMPLWGLVGTVLGLISMFDTLGADITVEALSPQLALALKTTLYGAVYSIIYRIPAVRFEQRIKALDNDYEALLRALDVIIVTKPIIEVEK